MKIFQLFSHSDARRQKTGPKILRDVAPAPAPAPAPVPTRAPSRTLFLLLCNLHNYVILRPAESRL